MRHPDQPTLALFRQYLDIERGTDRGDDEACLAECEDLKRRGELTPYGWRLLGVLHSRQERWGEAALAFAQARLGSDRPDLDRWLEAYARLSHGEPEVALATFSTILEERGEDPGFAATERREPLPFDVLALLEKYADGEAEQARVETQLWQQASAQRSTLSVAEVTQAVADTLWHLGRLDEALAAYERAEASLPLATAERARLLRTRGDLHAALEVLDGIADDNWEARELVAATRVDLQRRVVGLDVAVEEAQKAGLVREGMEDEPLLAPLLEHPAVRAVLHVDTSWLAAWPDLVRLSSSEELRAAGVRFLDEGAAREGGEALARYYAGNYHLGVIWSEELFGASRDMAHGKIKLADGPTLGNTDWGYTPRVELYVDLERPGTVFVLPCLGFPAALMIEVPAEEGALLAAFSALIQRERTPRVALTGHARAFLGYIHTLLLPNPYQSGSFDIATPLAFERHFASSPAVTANCLWGSAFADDPWPDRFPAQPNYALKLQRLVADYRQQGEGAICSYTRRTSCSRSQLALELHGQVWIADVRYRPSPFGEVVARLNALAGTSYPTDMPLDVVVALHGFGWMEEAELRAKLLEAPPEQVPAYLDVVAAVGCHDLRTLDLLRPFARREELSIRGSLYDVAATYNWMPLLFDLAPEEDPELADYVASAFLGGFAPPRYDHLGEPVGLMDRLEGAHE